MYVASFLQLWTTNKVKTFKNQKSHRGLLLLDIYKVLDYKWKKKIIKKITFSDVYFFISTIVN